MARKQRLVKRNNLSGETVEITPQQARWPNKAAGAAVHNINIVSWTDTANKYHDKAEYHLAQFLLYARKSGRALNAIKKSLPHGEWTKWLEKRFNGSRETARIYMRIAARWLDPRLIEARQSPNPPRSINAVVAILRHAPLPRGKKRPYTEKELTDEQNRKAYLRQMFKEEVDELSLEELTILCEDFEWFWNRIYVLLTKRLEHQLIEKQHQCKRVRSKIIRKP
jgi:hypothetical protein